jgi:uncharacterized protein
VTLLDLPLLSVADREEYERHYAESGTRISDMCFLSRYAWGEAFSYRKAVFRGGFCLISDGGCFTQPHLTMPLGRIVREDLAAIVDAAAPWFAARGMPVKVMYIDEPLLPLFQDLPGYKATLWHDEDYSDYVYDAESLRTLSGKALHGQRNHVSRFLREYPGCEFRPVTPEDRDDCLKIVSDWCTERGFDCHDHLLSDYVPIRRVFDAFPLLPVHGGVLRAGGRTVAFSLGSAGNADTAVIHFEKAVGELRGAYPVVGRYTVTDTFPGMLLVNREEDMGNEGIRTSKNALGPKEKLKKFNALLERM